MAKDREAIRKQIREHALKVFLEKGYIRATMRLIASACEMPLSSIHYYYRKKEEIFQDLAQPAVRNTERLMHQFRNPSLTDGRIDEAFIEETARMMLDNLDENHQRIVLILDRSEGSVYEHRKKAIMMGMRQVIFDIMQRYAEHIGTTIGQNDERNGYTAILAQFFVDLYASLAVQYRRSRWLYQVLRRTLKGGYRTVFDLVKEPNSNVD